MRVQEPASGLKVLGVKQPTGENWSGQTCLRKDGSVQLQWAPGTKTAALAQVPAGPDGTGRPSCVLDRVVLGAV